MTKYEFKKKIVKIKKNTVVNFVFDSCQIFIYGFFTKMFFLEVIYIYFVYLLLCMN